MPEKASTPQSSRTRATTGASTDAKNTISQETAQAVAASLAELSSKPAQASRTAHTAPRASRGRKTEFLDSIADSAEQAKKRGAQTQEIKAPTQQSVRPASAPLATTLSDPFAGQSVNRTKPMQAPVQSMTTLLFQAPDAGAAKVRRRVTSAPQGEEQVTKGSGAPAPRVAPPTTSAPAPSAGAKEEESVRPRRRGSRGRSKNVEANASKTQQKTPPHEPASTTATTEKPQAQPQARVATSEQSGTVTNVRLRTRNRDRSGNNASEPAMVQGSTRLEAKRQRRKEGRDAGRRRHSITESEYLARRESVRREMLIREQDGLNQIAVLEDDVLVEHYVARHTQASMVGNVYLGRVQNVLPSMEAAFVDIGKGRNAVLYAGEVNWEAAGMDGKPRAIEQALKTGDTVLVQVTKDPIGHKGARLTAQITLAGRHLVLVPSGAMTGISRKLPERERTRLKRLLKQVVPPEHSVIVRTAAEGASEEQLRRDVERLTQTWQEIQDKAHNAKNAPILLKGEPELAVRVVRDIFNEDFETLRIQGDSYTTISQYVAEMSPELKDRVSQWTQPQDIFAAHRVDEQLAKAFDRKVWLPSGGTLVIDRTEAMTVIDVNTGKFTGAGGTLEETVTRNNLEAAEEIVRQLRLRDIGGIIVVDFIDMVLESNRELVLRRLVECLGRDRTRHQVAEVTSLGLVQMTRKRVGQGLVEAFSTTCEECEGRGYLIHTHPVEHSGTNDGDKKHAQISSERAPVASVKEDEKTKAAMKSIAAAAKADRDESADHDESAEQATGQEKASEQVTGQKKVSEQAKASRMRTRTVKRSKPAAENTEDSVEKQGEEAKKVRQSRSASSGGTVVPSNSQGAILSFPAEK